MIQILMSLDKLTLGFICSISIFAVIFIISSFIPRTSHNLQKAPAFLTTLGILGTFFGIAWGLRQFNADQMQKSVPLLINGIKTAVWASACGVGWAVCLKIVDIIKSFYVGNKGGQAQGATINDLVSLLKDIKSALIGGEDSTLLDQLKLARQDSNDRIDGMKKSLEEFYSKIAQNNSAALIEALKEVIGDFNGKINEQFGDNFKQLNQAVEKTLQWQEQYRQQISEMITQQDQTSKNMATTVDSMSVATEKYQSLAIYGEKFNKTVNDMSALLAALETQKNQIYHSMELLSNLVNSATRGLPQIEKHITSLTEQLSNSVLLTSEKFSQNLLKTIQDSSQVMEKSIILITNNMNENMREAHEDSRKLLLNSISHSSQTCMENIEKINLEMNNQVKKMIEGTEEQIHLLDKALGEELTKSLESLGRQLAALSEKFVEDYSPLTERLKEIVSMVKEAA